MMKTSNANKKKETAFEVIKETNEIFLWEKEDWPETHWQVSRSYSRSAKLMPEKKCHLVGKRKLSTKKKRGTHKKEGEARHFAVFSLKIKVGVSSHCTDKRKKRNKGKKIQSNDKVSIYLEEKGKCFLMWTQKMKKILFKKGQYQLEI